MVEKNLVEVLLSVFTIEYGEVKTLLIRKKDDPYKGYWELPNSIVKGNEDIEQSVRNCLSNKSGLPVISYKLGGVFGNVNRKIDDRIIGINYLCFIDSKTVEMKQTVHLQEDIKWFKIDALPKLSFDYNKVLEDAINKLAGSMFEVETLKHFFPSDFTLPELQQAIEMVLRKKFDRRNFRKYFIKNEFVLATGDYSEKASGRPAKLYRFEEKIETIEII